MGSHFLEGKTSLRYYICEMLVVILHMACFKNSWAILRHQSGGLAYQNH